MGWTSILLLLQMHLPLLVSIDPLSLTPNDGVISSSNKQNPFRDISALLSATYAEQQGARNEHGPQLGASVADARIPRRVPLGSTFDVVFPVGVPLGLVLDSKLLVTGFRSPSRESARLASLNRMRAPAAVELALEPEHAQAVRAPLAQAGQAGLHANLPSFSLAEFSGLIAIGDMLVGMDGVPVWEKPHSSVMHMWRSDPYAAFLARVSRTTIKRALVKEAEQTQSWTFDPRTDVNVSVLLGPGRPLGAVVSFSLAAQHDATIPLSEALLSGPLSLLTCDPRDTERLASGGEPVELMDAQYASSVLLRRGALTGLAWPGDTLVALNGVSVTGLSVRAVLERMRVPQAGIAHVAGSVDGVMPLGYGAYLDRSEGSHPSSPLGVLTFMGGHSDVLCVAEGRYCRVSSDAAQDAVLMQDVARVLERGVRGGEKGGGSGVSRANGGRGVVKLTFRRSKTVPLGLLPHSRLAAAASTAYHSSGGAQGVRKAGSETAVCKGSGPSRRCSFRSADLVHLYVGSVGGAPVLSTESSEGRLAPPAQQDGTGGGRGRGQHVSSSHPPVLASPAQQDGTVGGRGRGQHVSSSHPPVLAMPAMFGGAFSCQDAPLVLAVPPDACAPLLTLPHAERLGARPPAEVVGGPPPSYRGAMVMVERGRCSFPSKALAVQAMGGVGMILINTGQDAPFAMPGAESGGTGSGGGARDAGADVAIAVVMVDGPSGDRLRNEVTSSRHTGRAASVRVGSPGQGPGVCGPESHGETQALSSIAAPPAPVGMQIDPYKIAAALRRGASSQGEVEEESLSEEEVWGHLAQASAIEVDVEGEAPKADSEDLSVILV